MPTAATAWTKFTGILQVSVASISQTIQHNLKVHSLAAHLFPLQKQHALNIWKYKSGGSFWRVGGTVMRSLRRCRGWTSTTVIVRWRSCWKEENKMLQEYKWHAALMISRLCVGPEPLPVSVKQMSLADTQWSGTFMWWEALPRNTSAI